MDRYWLLTWTTYGTWLPGDERGFVSNVDRGDGVGHRVNRLGTEPSADIPRLENYARNKLCGSPVFLAESQAEILLAQFHETAAIRSWTLLAVAIMRSHIHVVVGVMADPDPATLLRDLKGYGSRALNRRFECPASVTWWTESGSRRRLPDERAIAAAVEYVKHQNAPLLIWIPSATGTM